MEAIQALKDLSRAEEEIELLQKLLKDKEDQVWLHFSLPCILLSNIEPREKSEICAWTWGASGGTWFPLTSWNTRPGQRLLSQDKECVQPQGNEQFGSVITRELSDCYIFIPQAEKEWLYHGHLVSLMVEQRFVLQSLQF